MIDLHKLVNGTYHLDKKNESNTFIKRNIGILIFKVFHLEYFIVRM